MMQLERLKMIVNELGFCADMRGRCSFTPSPPRAPQTRRSPALVIHFAEMRSTKRGKNYSEVETCRLKRVRRLKNMEED